MYKLLIADDESRIRTGLADIIEWEVYGIEICGLAEDGTSAYRQIKTESPDIVLVDINMPNMDGLELIELCSHLDPAPKFIILSGYNDFEYVKKAIRLGAVDYLLKPVDEEELVHAITSCEKIIDEKKEHLKQFQRNLQTLQNDLLLRVLHNQVEPHEFREKSKVVDLSLYCPHMRVGILTLLPDVQGTVCANTDSAAICADICLSLCACYAFPDINNNIAVIFKSPTPPFQEADYLYSLSKCSAAVEAKLHCRVFYAIGREVSHISSLSASYQDCISKIEKKLILGDSLEDELSKNSFSMNYQDFIESLESGDKDKIAASLHSCCRTFLQQTKEHDISLFKYYLIDLATYALRSQYVNSYFSPELERKKQQVFTIIRDTDSVLKLEEMLTLFFISLTENTLTVSEEGGYPHIIQYVLTKIRTDYSDNTLSLKTIAGQLDVNPAYLGREFAVATGEYFNDFLNRLRISKAVQMLTTTSMKTSRISETVGFSNTSYFFTVFKKITGKSPGDYRT